MRIITILFLLFSTVLPASAELSDIEVQIARSVDDRFEGAISVLAKSVDIASATENFDGVRTLSDFYEREFDRLGFSTKWVALPIETGRAGHFVAEHSGSKGPTILFIGHLDTVLEGEPWSRDGDRGLGSGVADMKAGNLVILEALRALHGHGLLDERRFVVVFTGDEESPGEPTSTARAALIEAAKRSDIALAYEQAGNGSAVVGRRGISTWRLEVHGETGHSSAIFSENRGSGAIFEAARILAGFHEELREPNLTFNPAVIVGGTDVDFNDDDSGGTAHGKSNVVAQSVIVKGDLRFLTRQQLEAAMEKMREIVSRSLPKTSATIGFSEKYPAMAPTDGNRRLLAKYDEVSQDLGFGPVAEYDPGKRGAGDISFIAEFVDGLDGLGAFGERSHAPGESVDLATLKMQIMRTAVLVYRLTR